MIRSLVTLRSRRWAWLAWMSIWVFSLSALMPTLSAWAASAHAPDSWVEVCSSQGAKWVRASDKSSDDTGHLFGNKGHCAFCLLQQHAPLLPTQTISLDIVALSTTELLPKLFLRSPRTLFAWSPLSARAPPLTA